MSYIAIINGNGNLKKFIRAGRIAQGRRKRYLLLGEPQEQAVSLLEGNGFSRIMNPEINEDFRTRFLKEYVDLVGALGRECSSRMWWATDIASKNRFTSRLSFLLYQFFIAAETASKKDYDYLIILNPPWVIISSLTAMLKEQKLDFACYGSMRDEIISIGISWFKRIPILFYVIFKKTYQLYYSKKKDCLQSYKNIQESY